MKGKYILLISGASHAGKTSTLRKLIQRLGLTPLNARSKEWYAIGTCADDCGEEEQVCVCTKGDPIRKDDKKKNKDSVKNFVDKAVQQDIRIIIVASRTSGYTVDRWDEYKAMGYMILKMNKHRLEEDCPNGTAPSRLLAKVWNILNDKYVDEIEMIVKSLIQFG